MKPFPLGLILLIVLVTAPACSAVNFTEFAAYGDSWIANNGTHYLIKWNATGTHDFITGGNCSQVLEYLIVAGGGGAAANGHSGGGGGGLLTGYNMPVSGIVNITVGAGGAAGAAGGNSTFNLTAVGGGYGAYNANGGSGGSGGGGGSSSISRTAGSGTAGQGNAGGANRNSNPYPGGSGGGAGGAGNQPASGSTPANGGIGLNVNITGVLTCYAGGGAGSVDGGSWGTATCGGGASATSGTGVNGTGGGGSGSPSNAGAAGGSGVVIIMFENPDRSMFDLIADFSKSPSPSLVKKTVHFTDNSNGDPISWYWTFGDISDDNTSTDQNPEHAYLEPGIYSISLNITNSTGHYNETTINQTVTNTSIGNVDDYTLLGIPDTATEITIDPKYQTFEAPSGKAITAIDLTIPLGTSGTFDITQANGETVDGSFSYTGWPSATFTATIGGSSSTEEYSWPNQLLAPAMHVRVGIGVSTVNTTDRGISLGYGHVAGWWNHVVSEQVTPSPVVRFHFDADQDIIGTAIFNDFTATLQSWITGLVNNVTDQINRATDLIDRMASYSRLMWGVFLSALYWLKFLFVDNLILTVTLYMTGTLAYATLTSRNVFEVLKKWFRQQKAIFEFMVAGFNLVVGIISNLVSIIK